MGRVLFLKKNIKNEMGMLKSSDGKGEWIMDNVLIDNRLNSGKLSYFCTFYQYQLSIIQL
ncbi:hypothetical protein EGI32_14660 [Ferruginibacter sp. HRS2-29]|nr:hypothetical protein [Ferruginibacter sp. HRS2-29]MCP9752206.1 hypothetical protein [Ferruginibacter sp. HRS2-29]